MRITKSENDNDETCTRIECDDDRCCFVWLMVVPVAAIAVPVSGDWRARWRSLFFHVIFARSIRIVPIDSRAYTHDDMVWSGVERDCANETSTNVSLAFVPFEDDSKGEKQVKDEKSRFLYRDTIAHR